MSTCVVSRSSYRDNQVCLFCLKEHDNDVEFNNRNYQLFSQFLAFSKSYLKVNSGYTKLSKNNHLQQDSLPGFCEQCGNEVTLILKLHSELNKLKCKLLWKLMVIGDTIKKSRARRKKYDHREKNSQISNHAVSSSLLQLLRHQITKKCDWKSRKILPNVIIDRKSNSSSIHSDIGQCLFHQTSHTNLLASSTANKVGFESVHANSRLVTIPSRDMLRFLCVFLLLLSLAHGWNLEKLLLLKHQRIFSSTTWRPSSPAAVVQISSKRRQKRSRKIFNCKNQFKIKENAIGSAKNVTKNSASIKVEPEHETEVTSFQNEEQINFNNDNNGQEKAVNAAVDKFEVNLPSPEASIVSALDFAAGDDDDAIFGIQEEDDCYQNEINDQPQQIIFPDDSCNRTAVEDNVIVTKKRKRKLNHDPHSEFSKQNSKMFKKLPKGRKTKQAERQSESIVPKQKRKRRSNVGRINPRKIKLGAIKNSNSEKQTDDNATSSSREMSSFSIKCSECEETFTSLFSLEDHLQKQHSKRSDVTTGTCSICNAETETEFSLFLHLQETHENTEDKPIRCIYCVQSFATEECHQLHRKNVHWFYPQKLPCEVHKCSESFSRTQELEQHYKSVHLYKDLVSCDQCHWTFLSARRLHLHQFSHEEPNQFGSYQCPKCLNQYRSALELAIHFNRGTRPYHINPLSQLEDFQCLVENCDQRFFSEKELDLHGVQHALYEKQLVLPSVKNTMNKLMNKNTSCFRVRSLMCIYCRQSFSSRKGQKVHEHSCSMGASPERRQKANAKLMCGKCFYATNARIQMIKHLATHQDAKLECPHCDGKYGRSDHLRLHILRKHSGEEKKVVCHLCGVKRATEYEMRYHLAEHEKSHLCQECGQKFSRAWLLSVHLRKHSGEKIQCEWCPKICRCVSELKKHYETRHPEQVPRDYKGKAKRYVKYRLVQKGDRRRRENKEMEEQVDATLNEADNLERGELQMEVEVEEEEKQGQSSYANNSFNCWNVGESRTEDMQL